MTQPYRRVAVLHTPFSAAGLLVTAWVAAAGPGGPDRAEDRRSTVRAHLAERTKLAAS